MWGEMWGEAAWGALPDEPAAPLEGGDALTAPPRTVTLAASARVTVLVAPERVALLEAPGL